MDHRYRDKKSVSLCVFRAPLHESKIPENQEVTKHLQNKDLLLKTLQKNICKGTPKSAMWLKK
jgi:hypothetical protein